MLFALARLSQLSTSIRLDAQAGCYQRPLFLFDLSNQKRQINRYIKHRQKRAI